MPGAVKKAMAWALNRGGLSAGKRRGLRGVTAILSYPRILPRGELLDNHPTGSALTGAAFREHVQWLERHFDVISLNRLCSRYLIGEKPTRPTCVMTFDDGLIETFDVAWPIMEERNLTGTLFLPTDMIGTFDALPEIRINRAALGILDKRTALMARFPDEQMPPECAFVIDLLVAGPATRKFVDAFQEKLTSVERSRLPEVIDWLCALGSVKDADKPTHLTWTHAKALAESGFEIGSQSASGVALDETDAMTAQTDLARSMSAISENIGRGPVPFRYPDGSRDERITRMVRKCGFLCGLTNNTGFAEKAPDLFSLPRIAVNQENAPSALALEALLSFL